MMAENLTADTEGKDIPYNGDDFKDMSRRYHRKYEEILEELEEKDATQETNTSHNNSEAD